MVCSQMCCRTSAKAVAAYGSRDSSTVATQGRQLRYLQADDASDLLIADALQLFQTLPA